MVRAVAAGLLFSVPVWLLTGCGGGSDTTTTPTTTTSAPTAHFDLPFSDINVMIVTDVHSWIAGHKHEPEVNATYGDVLSFYERLREDCDDNDRDLFFVMNGDINDGTGLSTDPPIELVPLLEHMPWDAVTVGNHELYKNEFIEYMAKPGGFLEHWGDRYLTGNVINATTGKPWGRTHKFLRGKHGTTLLTLGFLYNMTDHDSDVEVLHAEDVVEQQWFQDVVTGKEGEFDAVMVLSHMHYVDSYVYVILDAIRKLQPEIPIQFVTGHSHKRLYEPLDATACSFEAGHYLDTVGFASFPTLNNSKKNTSEGKAKGFSHVFIDANIGTLNSLAGMQDISTKNGTALTKLIKEARSEMGLSATLGCAPMTYNMFGALNETDSLWKLIIESLIVDVLFEGNNTDRVYIQSTGSARYDLFEGNVTKDDIITMMPFADEFWLVSESIAGEDIAKALGDLNKGAPYPLKPFVNTDFEEGRSYAVYSGSFDVGTLEKPGELVEQLESQLKQTLAPKMQWIDKNTTSLWYEYVPKAWPCNGTVVLL